MPEPIRWGLTPIEYNPEEVEEIFPSGLNEEDIENGEILLDSKRGNLYYKNKETGKISKLRHNNTYQVLVNSDNYSLNLSASGQYSKDMEYIRTVTNNNPDVIHTIGDIIIIREVKAKSGYTYPCYSTDIDGNDDASSDLYSMRTYIRTDNVNKISNSDTSYDTDSEKMEWLPIGGGIKSKTSDTRLETGLRVVGTEVGKYKDWDYIDEGTSVYDILKGLLQNVKDPTIEQSPYLSGNISFNLKYGYRSSWQEFSKDFSRAMDSSLYLPWGGDYEIFKINSLNTFNPGYYSFTFDNNGNRTTSKQGTGCTITNRRVRDYSSAESWSSYITYTNSISLYISEHNPNSSSDRVVLRVDYSAGNYARNNAGEKTNIRVSSGYIERVVTYLKYYKPFSFMCFSGNTANSFSDKMALDQYFCSVNTTIRNRTLNKYVSGMTFNSDKTFNSFTDLTKDYGIPSNKSHDFIIKAGTQCIEFVIPDDYSIKSIINPDMMNRDVINDFTVKTITNADLNTGTNGNSTELINHVSSYKIYTYTCDIPFSKDVTFKITFN